MTREWRREPAAKRHEERRSGVKGCRGGAHGNLHLCEVPMLAGTEREVSEALEEVLGPTRNASGRLGINRLFDSPGRLFCIHSMEAGRGIRDSRAAAATVRFRERMETLIHPVFEVTRTEPLA